MSDFNNDKKWSDRFIVEIKRILGEHLISEAPIEEDISHNTDLMVLKLDAIRVACRIRKYYYFTIYPNDITIRSKRPSGSETELSKIINGWGDYMFYGFSDETESQLVSWKLISLDNLREWIIKNSHITSQEKQNKDNSSSFITIDTNKMEQNIIYRQSN